MAASPSINSSLGGDWGTLIILRASTWIIMAGRRYLRVATAIPCAPTYRRRTNYVQPHPGSARSKTVKQPSIRKHHLSDFSTCEAILWHYDANFTTSRVTPRYFCWILQVWVLPVLLALAENLKEGTPFFTLQKPVLPRPHRRFHPY